tara:strand:- start:3919 stop:4377 length:459 start_codon:yes stop_codon:yes gene_type:complete
MTIDAMLRSADRATMEATMLRFGILVEEVTEPTYDDDGTVLTEGFTTLRPAAGVHIKWGIPIWTTKPTYDAEGNVLTEGVQDARFHADMRVVSPATETIDEDSGLPKVQYILDIWRWYGTEGTPNKNEESFEFFGVEWIDPETVSSPAHRFM